MSGYPGIRASHEDRNRAAAALGAHYAAGRLTLEEFQERLDEVYAATTLGELDHLMADLPGTDLGRLPERRSPGPVQVPAGGSALAWRAVIRCGCPSGSAPIGPFGATWMGCRPDGRRP
jgi:Domain of unknown function (DUF1707)